MELIRVDQKDKWNEAVKSFVHWDIYYLNEYAASMKLHGDGEPVLLYFNADGCRMAYVMMENDVADFEPFRHTLDRGTYYDWTTPYGYGGPLYEGDITEQWLVCAYNELKWYASKNRIVSQFFRYHPLLQNQQNLEKLSRVLYMKKTVYIDTESEELIYANMTPNNRNMIRKAKKNGVIIFTDHGERLSEFIDVYEETMKNHNAEEYYYFKRSYFEYLIENMSENLILFYALFEGKVVSASIFFYNNNYMHYHLSGTLAEYRNLGAANLLLTEASVWAAQMGIKKFHLGGGVEEEDSLLRFKKHFNRRGLIDFCIGCDIFNQKDFKELVELRKETDETFDAAKPFMIQYRG